MGAWQGSASILWELAECPLHVPNLCSLVQIPSSPLMIVELIFYGFGENQRVSNDAGHCHSYPVPLRENYYYSITLQKVSLHAGDGLTNRHHRVIQKYIPVFLEIFVGNPLTKQNFLSVSAILKLFWGSFFG